jgi:HK97 family phage prohead protease
MKLIIRNESITIEGYVNAVERNSKPLTERGVTFIERVSAGAFNRAIRRAKDIRILLNHRKDRDLGGISDGNLELEEDNIGLKARATITDPEVIEDAKHGDLVGWSFGFYDVLNGVKQMRDEESGLPLRKLNDLELYEVSLLNRKKSPAYVGTLVNVRDDGTTDRINIADEYCDNLETVNECEDNTENTPSNDGEGEKREDTKPGESSAEKEVSSEYYAGYRNMIGEMKNLVKNKKED